MRTNWTHKGFAIVFAALTAWMLLYGMYRLIIGYPLFMLPAIFLASLILYVCFRINPRDDEP